MKKILFVLLLVFISFTSVFAKEIDVDGLKSKAVSQGQDGLVLDQETKRYFYQGENVNNFITFNNELWRILSVEKDGTLKIMAEVNERIETNSYYNQPSYESFLNEFYSSINNDKDYIINGNFIVDEYNYVGNNILDGDSELSVWNSYTGLGRPGGEYLYSNLNLNNKETLNGYINFISLLEFKKTTNSKKKNWIYNVSGINEANEPICIDVITTSNLILPINTIGHYKDDLIPLSSRYYTNFPNKENDFFTTFTTSNSNRNGQCDIKKNPTVYIKPGFVLTGSGTLDDPYVLNYPPEKIKPSVIIVKDDKRVENINLKKNDEFKYEVTQKVHTLGDNIQDRYTFFSLITRIPKEVKYIGAKIYDENGVEITDGKFEYNKETNEVIWTANDSFLDENSNNHIKMQGEIYKIIIDSKLIDDNASSIIAYATLNYKVNGSDELIITKSNNVLINSKKISNPLTSNNLLFVMISSILVLGAIIIVYRIKKLSSINL